MSGPNGVMYQSFQWHSRNDGKFWDDLASRAETLKDQGFDAVWIPPAYKGHAGADDVGYGVYDLFDLGEFDQKGSVRTRYGTHDQLVTAVATMRRHGLHVYADVVLNHRLGGDVVEDVKVVEIDPADRNQALSEPIDAKAWTGFTFPGRAGKYDDFTLSSRHFIAIDHLESGGTPGRIYLIHPKTFSGEVSFEQGNFDYLMGCDVDLYDDQVRAHLFRWAHWFVNELKMDGLRLDAVKHLPASFIRDMVKDLREHSKQEHLFAVGEYWSADVGALQAYLTAVDGATTLFDVPLHFNFHRAAKSGNGFDLRTIFDNTLVATAPQQAVTFVDNHDSEPGQSLESWVDPWFKPIAYSLILLREAGYPCVFAGDVEGLTQNADAGPAMGDLMATLLKLRKHYAIGPQQDIFDHANCVAWTRDGGDRGPMAVVCSNGDAGTKRFAVPGGAMTLVNVLDPARPTLTTADDGQADFTCPAGGVAVWVRADRWET
jgi:alpha-amylase